MGKRWEGSDVPASILEAGQLFASRMRMSRSIRQLWDVRERFIRHERGWNEVPKDDASNGSSASMIEEDESDEVEGKIASTDEPKQTESRDRRQEETSNEGAQRQLNAIEAFYVRSILLHDLQLLTTSSVMLYRTSNPSCWCCGRSSSQMYPTWLHQ